MRYPKSCSNIVDICSSQLSAVQWWSHLNSVDVLLLILCCVKLSISVYQCCYFVQSGFGKIHSCTTVSYHHVQKVCLSARVRHLLLFVATAWTLFQSTPWSTRFSLNVDRQVFVGRPRRLPLPRGVHDMAWLAGHPGGILMIWPAIWSRLSATMSVSYTHLTLPTNREV